MSVTSDVAFRIKATDQGAEQAFVGVGNAQEKLKEKTEKVAGAAREQTKSVKDLQGTWLSMAGAALGIGSVGAVLAKITEQVEDTKRALKELGQVGMTESQKLNSLRSIQQPGDAGKAFMATTLKTAANLGLKPGEAAQIIEPIQSALNPDGGAITPEERDAILGALAAAGKGRVIGISPEVAGFIEVQGAARGMQPGELTAMTLEASTMSSFSKSQFGQALPQAQTWSDINEAMAAAVTISGQITDPGQFGTMLKNAGKVLGPSGNALPFVETIGARDMGPIERLRAMREFAVTNGLEGLGGAKSPQELAQMSAGDRAQYAASSEQAIDKLSRSLVGFQMDSEAATAVGALMRGLDQFEGLVEQFKRERGIGAPDEGARRLEYTARQVDGMFQKVLAMPGASEDLIVARAEATHVLDRLIGPEAEKERAAVIADYVKGAEAMRVGDVATVDPGTGRYERSRDALYWPKKAFDLMFGFDAGGAFNGPDLLRLRRGETLPPPASDPAARLDYEIGQKQEGFQGAALPPEGEGGLPLLGLLISVSSGLQAFASAMEGATEAARNAAATPAPEYQSPPAVIQQARNRIANKRNLDAGL